MTLLPDTDTCDACGGLEYVPAAHRADRPTVDNKRVSAAAPIMHTRAYVCYYIPRRLGDVFLLFFFLEGG